MQVEIVTIGDELLIGQVVDTNSAWMASQLDKAGFSVNRVTSVSDSEEEILNVLGESTRRASIVLLTGGLGPTRDDITKGSLCKFFNTRLVFNQEVLTDIETLLKGRVPRINRLNHDQAMVPEGCTVIRNPVGTAPVMWFNYNSGAVVAMPGVPSEMKSAMEHEVIPRLKEKFTSKIIIHKTINIFNIAEATLAEKLRDWENSVPPFIKVAYLPSTGKIRLRLSCKGEERVVIEEALCKWVKALYPIIGENIYGFDDEKIEEVLVKFLLNNKITLSLAESCTGGYMSHLVTSVPGASMLFTGSVVAYANEIKTSILGVLPCTIREHGAVSGEVVEQMATGAREVFKTDFAIATSGIAGPTGGSDEKPVGTVWIGWAGKERVVSRVFNFGSNRHNTTIRAGETGLIMLKKFIETGVI